jgi:hypothetical protein
VERTPVLCVHSGQIPEKLVQVEHAVRPSSPLLIRVFGIESRLSGPDYRFTSRASRRLLRWLLPGKQLVEIVLTCGN